MKAEYGDCKIEVNPWALGVLALAISSIAWAFVFITTVRRGYPPPWGFPEARHDKVPVG